MIKGDQFIKLVNIGDTHQVAKIITGTDYDGDIQVNTVVKIDGRYYKEHHAFNNIEEARISLHRFDQSEAETIFQFYDRASSGSNSRNISSNFLSFDSDVE